VVTFSGAVLTGGASRRMGRDKALLPVEGRPLVLVAATALQDAGASSVVCVGGDLDGLAALGLTVVADEHPGEGPLGALITALGQAEHDLVAVLSCDLPHADPSAVRAIVDALASAPAAHAAIPVVDGRRQLLHGAYRRRTLSHWVSAFEAGERALHRPARALQVVEIAGLDESWLRDADRPEDLPGSAV
jgi:molybdopterin-guanine dinucleotide biosynthesis protein A